MARLKTALCLFPLCSGAMAVNVFFASLLGSWLDWPVLGTTPSLILGGIIGGPMSWWLANHLHRLMDEADAVN